MTTLADLFSVIRDAQLQGVDDRALRAEAMGWYEVLVEPGRQLLLMSRGTTTWVVRMMPHVTAWSASAIALFNRLDMQMEDEPTNPP